MSPLKTSRAISNQYVRAPNISAMKSFDVTWDGPMTYMIVRANELAFRTAYATSSMSPEIAGSAGLDDRGPSAAAWDLTFKQPDNAKSDFDTTPIVSIQHCIYIQSGSNYSTHRGSIARITAILRATYLAILPTNWGWWDL